MITSEDYVSKVLRTDSPITEELLARLQNPETVRLLHAAMGACTEAGEFLDMLKKHIFYGRKIDLVNAAEEVGDSLWYAGLAIDVLRTTMNEVLTININKLQLRYPEKFAEDCAVNRNVDAERTLLEDSIAITEMKRNYSNRALDWIKFSLLVLNHIETYTVPQYGDKPNDQIESWSIEECLKAVSKRIARFGRNSREGQQELDFKKMAHEIQIAAEKYFELQK